MYCIYTHSAGYLDITGVIVLPTQVILEVTIEHQDCREFWSAIYYCGIVPDVSICGTGDQDSISN